jgi:hypothetical protein
LKEIVMNRSIARIAATTALVVTAAAHAGASPSDKAMMNACVQRYIADQLADYQGEVKVKKLADSYHPVAFHTRAQVKVTAFHRASGEQLRTVLCNVAKDGSLTVATLGVTSTKPGKIRPKLTNAPVVAGNARE